jgi:hypothetical protein
LHPLPLFVYHCVIGDFAPGGYFKEFVFVTPVKSEPGNRSEPGINGASGDNWTYLMVFFSILCQFTPSDTSGVEPTV